MPEAQPRLDFGQRTHAEQERAQKDLCSCGHERRYHWGGTHACILACPCLWFLLVRPAEEIDETR